MSLCIKCEEESGYNGKYFYNDEVGEEIFLCDDCLKKREEKQNDSSR